MSIFRNRRVLAGMALGLYPANAWSWQGPPAVRPIADQPPLISAIPGPAAPPPAPQFLASPSVVEVPPYGLQPTWSPGPLDPAATTRHPPKFVVHKARSWHWRRLQGRFYGYPEEFEPRPLGAALYDSGKIMAANGAAARLVLFQYDFDEGTSRLSPRGRDQLAKCAAQLAVSPFPLIIERTPSNPMLALARRNAIAAELANGPFRIPPERVLVGLPMSAGLSGIDAQIIGANALNRTQQYGPAIPINSNGLNSPTGVTNNMSGTVPGQ